MSYWDTGVVENRHGLVTQRWPLKPLRGRKRFPHQSHFGQFSDQFTRIGRTKYNHHRELEEMEDAAIVIRCYRS